MDLANTFYTLIQFPKPSQKKDTRVDAIYSTTDKKLISHEARYFDFESKHEMNDT